MQDYESACFSYACAIGQGARGKEYKRKIQNLHQEHGPFTFERQLSKMKKEYCDCCESCGEGAMSTRIREINGKKLCISCAEGKYWQKN